MTGFCNEQHADAESRTDDHARLKNGVRGIVSVDISVKKKLWASNHEGIEVYAHRLYLFVWSTRVKTNRTPQYSFKLYAPLIAITPWIHFSRGLLYHRAAHNQSSLHLTHLPYRHLYRVDVHLRFSCARLDIVAASSYGRCTHPLHFSIFARHVARNSIYSNRDCTDFIARHIFYADFFFFFLAASVA